MMMMWASCVDVTTAIVAGGRPDVNVAGPSSGRRGDEDGDGSLGLRLVIGVVGEHRHGAVPPDRSLVARGLAHRHGERLRTVLHADVGGVGDQVVVPDRVGRSPTHRRHQCVLALVLHAHQGDLAQEAR